jgi:Leucine-rich repeat (LRR) protein
VRHLTFLEEATDGGLVADLLSAPGFSDLRAVSFHDDENAKNTVRAVISHLPDTVRSLHFLGHMSTTFDDAVAADLASSPRVAQLEHLTLYNCNLREDGAVALGRGTFRELEGLRLGRGQYSRNMIGPNGTIAIAESLDFLESLDLDFNSIGDRGVRALRSASRRHRLQLLHELHLQANEITDDGIEALCQSALVHQLTLLDLRHNPISSAGLDHLVLAAPTRLKRLWLGGHRIYRGGTKRLAESWWARQLDELHVS